MDGSGGGLVGGKAIAWRESLRLAGGEARLVGWEEVVLQGYLSGLVASPALITYCHDAAFILTTVEALSNVNLPNSMSCFPATLAHHRQRLYNSEVGAPRSLASWFLHARL